MTRIRLPAPGELPELETLYRAIATSREEVAAKLGVTPNDLISEPWRAIGNRPELADSLWEYRRRLLKQGALTEQLKEGIAIAVARARSNWSCVDTHSTWLQELGVPEDMVREYQHFEASDRIGEREKVALRFGVKAATRPSEVADEDVADLRRQGYDDAAIVEIVLAATFEAFLVTVKEVFGLQDRHVVERMGRYGWATFAQSQAAR